AAGLVHTFNHLGAGIVAGTVFLSSLFLVTRFSFSWAAAFLKARWLALARPIAARWNAWQEARAEAAEERRRRRAEAMRLRRKPPVIAPKVTIAEAAPAIPATPPVAPSPEAEATEPRDSGLLPAAADEAPLRISAASLGRARKPESDSALAPRIV